MTGLKEEIRRAYESGEGTFQKLSEKYNVKVGTIKSWAKRDKDEGKKWIKVASKQKTKSEKVATKNEDMSWIDIENEYVKDIRRKPSSLEDLSKKYNISLQTIFDYSAANEWSFKRREYNEITKKKVKAKSPEHSCGEKRKRYKKTIQEKVNWKLIKDEYLKSGGEIFLKDLADNFGVNDATLRSRKRRESWDNELNNSVSIQRYNDCYSGINHIRARDIDKLNNSFITYKQKLFCLYYLKYLNAGKAAKKAGYQCKYPNGFYEIGCQLLKKTQVKNEIDKLKKNIIQNIGIEIMDVLQIYINIAFSDITDFIELGQREVIVGEDEKGNPIKEMKNYIDLKGSREVDGTLIQEITFGKTGIALKLHDKMKALDILARYTGLLDIGTQQELEIEQRKMALLEKQADELDEDIEYVIED